MNQEIGYHIVGPDALDDLPQNGEQLSIIQFLRLVQASERLPLHTTVQGLDDLLAGSDDPEAVCDLIHEVLADGVNHVVREQPVVQFVVDDLEFWDEPVITHHNDRVPLRRIFSGDLTQEGADWFYCRLNVTS